METMGRCGQVLTFRTVVAELPEAKVHGQAIVGPGPR